MSYREDHDAAAARIEALVRENRRLRDEVAAKQRAADLVRVGEAASLEAALSAAVPPDTDAALAHADALEADNSRLTAILAEVPKRVVRREPPPLPEPVRPPRAKPSRVIERVAWGLLVATIGGAMVLVVRACSHVERSTTTDPVTWGDVTFDTGAVIRPDWCRGSYTGNEIRLYQNEWEVALFTREHVKLWRDAQTAMPIDKARCRTFAVNIVVTPATDEDRWPYSDGSLTLDCDGVRGRIAFKNCH